MFDFTKINRISDSGNVHIPINNKITFRKYADYQRVKYNFGMIIRWLFVHFGVVFHNNIQNGQKNIYLPKWVNLGFQIKRSFNPDMISGLSNISDMLGLSNISDMLTILIKHIN